MNFLRVGLPAKAGAVLKAAILSFRLGRRSVSRLKGVHPDLVRVVRRAIVITTVDFTVLEGVRLIARQRVLFESGASKIMNSRHLTGHAVDLGAYVGGRISWDWPLYYKIADAMIQASEEEDVPIRWGGDWDSDGEYDDEKWRDGPHYELPRKLYPN